MGKHPPRIEWFSNCLTETGLDHIVEVTDNFVEALGLPILCQPAEFQRPSFDGLFHEWCRLKSFQILSPI